MAPKKKELAQWVSRIVGYGERGVAEIIANPRNWRRHTSQQLDGLLQAFQRVGIIQNLIVNVRQGAAWGEDERGQEVLLDGHGRVMLARKQRQGSLPVTLVDLDPEAEREALLTFDYLGTMAEAEPEGLRTLLAEARAGEQQVVDLLDVLEARWDVPEVGAVEETLTPSGGKQAAPMDLEDGQEMVRIQVSIPTTAYAAFQAACKRLGRVLGTDSMSATIQASILEQAARREG